MYKIETEEEVDGRWIAEVPELPGVMAYGKSRDEAVRKAQALSLRVLAERLENGEPLPQVVFAFHDREEIGPRMLARIAKQTRLRPEDL